MKLAGIKSLLAWSALFLSCSLSSAELTTPLPLTAQNPALIAPGGGYWFKPEPSTLTLTSQIPQALAHINFPVLVTGIGYGWRYFSPAGYNLNPELIATATLVDSQGESVFKNTYVYNAYNNNAIVAARMPVNNMPGTNLTKLELSFAYQHPQAWPGAYGNYSPRIRDIWADITYKPNTCLIDPLSSVNCAGYAQALLDQQCAANPLTNTKCSGYEQAFLQQQCGISALWSTQCAGYAEALQAKNFAQACNTNPQSSPQCAGYVLVVQTQPVVADPVREVFPKLVEDSTVQAALDATQIKQTIELQEPPRTREQAIKQATQAKKPEANAEARTGTQSRGSALAREQPSIPVTASETTFQDYTQANLTQYMRVELPDAAFYVSRQIYTTNTIQDNPRTLRQLSNRSQQLHRRLVDEQYEKSR